MFYVPIKITNMMDSKEAGFYASLLNVLTENASFEDKERVAQWIDSDQENRKIFCGLKDSFHHSDSEFSSELVFARLKKRIKHGGNVWIMNRPLLDKTLRFYSPSTIDPGSLSSVHEQPTLVLGPTKIDWDQVMDLLFHPHPAQ